MDELFSGEFYYCTQCGTCGAISERKCPFAQLELPVKGKSITVEDSLAMFQEKESLRYPNQYYCEVELSSLLESRTYHIFFSCSFSLYFETLDFETLFLH